MQRRKAGKYRNIGLLLMRIGLGIAFMIHGYPKLFGGPEMWLEYGSRMQYLGIEGAPMFFGFMAGIIEFFGGVFLVSGLFFNQILVLLILVMMIAAAIQIGQGAGYPGYSYPLKMIVVFLSLLFIGPGKYSLDETLTSRRNRYY